MNLLAAIDYDLFTFGPFEVPLLSDLTADWFGAPLQIHSFGMFVAIGLLTTFTLCARRGEQKMGIDGEEVQNFGIYLIAIGWIFAHIFNVLFYEPHLMKEDPLILFKFWGSISSYGGLFGGIIAAWIWRVRNREKDFLAWCDLAAWGLTFSWFFGRVGCASVHDHPGKETDFALGIVCNLDGGCGANWAEGVIRHDLGFYEAMWWGVIVLAVLILDRKPRPKGFYLALVPTLYAPARFLFDFLRVAPDEVEARARFLMTPAQWFSIGIFLVGLYFWNRVRKNPPMEWKTYKYEPESEKDGTADDEGEDATESSGDDADDEADRKRKHRKKKRR